MKRHTLGAWGLELGQTGIAAIALAIVAHSAWRASGAKAAYLVEFGAIAALVVNLIWAVAVVARARVAVTQNASDAVVGDAPLVEIDLRGAHRTVQLRMVSSPGALPVRARAPEAGPLPSIASFRGVAGWAVVEVLWRGPLGLAGVSRTRTVPLVRPLYIGPRQVPVPGVTFPGREVLGVDSGSGPLGPGDVVRGVRDYMPGDPMRLVHWGATARTGEVVVKEVELPAAPAVTIVADLSPGGPSAETTAGRAAWLCAQALRTGHRVALVTNERDRRAATPVTSPLEVNRRLAAAMPGPVALPGAADATGACLVVDISGVRWQRG